MLWTLTSERRGNSGRESFPRRRTAGTEQTVAASVDRLPAELRDAGGNAGGCGEAPGARLGRVGGSTAVLISRGICDAGVLAGLRASHACGAGARTAVEASGFTGARRRLSLYSGVQLVLALQVAGRSGEVRELEMRAAGVETMETRAVRVSCVRCVPSAGTGRAASAVRLPGVLE